jgi:hypothetical protein
MNLHESSSEDDSDFGHTVPGFRSGEGSRSILPYLKNSLKVNPNHGQPGVSGLSQDTAAKPFSPPPKPPQDTAVVRPDAVLMPRSRKPN